MQQRLCPRCHFVVHFEDESTLVFCSHCGAPQVTVSEEMLEQARRTQSALTQNSEEETEAQRAARIAAQPPELYVVWKSAIKIMLVVSAAISILCLFFPLEILSWLAPGIVLGLYSGRHRETKLTAAVGARVGLVCGIFCACGITLVKTLQMLYVRYALHQSASLDQALMQTIVQAKARAVAQSGDAAAASIFNPLLYQPEFRVGFYLCALLFVACVLLALSTLSGAFSGYMRSRRALR